MTHCPNCGHKLNKPGKVRRVVTAYGGWRVNQRRTFENTADVAPWEPDPPGQSGYFEAERRRPARPANIESDFLTPLLQAGGVTLFVALVSIYVTWYFDLALHLACFGGIVAGGLWFIASLMVNREMLWIVEKVVNEDIDRDGHIGEPRQLAPLEVLHKDDAGAIKTMYRLDLPDIDDNRLVEFAKGALIKGLAESNWIGRGNLFSKAEYGKLLSELDRAQIIEWVNPKAKSQGRQFTAYGKKALRGWAQLS